MFHHLHNGEGTNRSSPFRFSSPLASTRPHFPSPSYRKSVLFLCSQGGFCTGLTVDAADLCNERLSIKAPPGIFFFSEWEGEGGGHSAQSEKICSLNVLKWPFCPLGSSDRRLPLIESGMMRIYVTVNLLRNQSEGFFFYPPFPSPNVEDLTVVEFKAIKKKKHPTCPGSSDMFLLLLPFGLFFSFLFLSHPV